MISEDEYLERIVAGIHATSSAGAQVAWNEKINGRQFDVVVRFALGTLRYLVVVEVKNRTRRASASDVEAFVTKADDQNANKAVFVTAAGFQSGAIDVAKRHGVDLFKVEFAKDEVELFTNESVIAVRGNQVSVGFGTTDLNVNVGEPTLAAQIERATLVYRDGRRINLPDERSQMEYYAARTQLKSGQSIEEIVASSIPRLPALGERIVFSADFKRPQLIEPPDEFFFPRGKIKQIEFEAVGGMMRPLSGNTMVEPTSFRSPVVYTNCLTGEVLRYSLSQLPLGLQKCQPGLFYFLPHPLRYFFCEKIEDEIVHWTMVESFQCKHLIRTKYTQNIKYSHYYMPVNNKGVLRRLKARLDELRALGG